MRITAVSIKLFEQDKLKAFATITIDDCLVVRGIKIIAGRKGLFVAMPNRRRPDFSFQDVAHPVTVKAREELEHIVLEAYRQALLTGASQNPTSDGGPPNDDRRDISGGSLGIDDGLPPLDDDED
jgi:stage V sporulation protein G